MVWGVWSSPRALELPISPLPGPLLYQFHVVGREHPKVAVRAVAAPPALIDHLNVGDDVLRIKGDLGVISCSGTQRGEGGSDHLSYPSTGVPKIRGMWSC